MTGLMDKTNLCLKYMEPVIQHEVIAHRLMGKCVTKLATCKKAAMQTFLLYFRQKKTQRACGHTHMLLQTSADVIPIVKNF